MTNTITVSTTPGFKDALGDSVLKSIHSDLGIDGITSVKTSNVYKFGDSLEPSEMEELGRELFADSIVERFDINKPHSGAGWMIEVGLKPGVKDNEGEVASSAVEMLLDREIPVYRSMAYFLEGNINRRRAEEIASKLLANASVDEYRITRPLERFEYLPIPRVTITKKPEIGFIDIPLHDYDSIELSNRRMYALNIVEMRTMREYFHDPDVIKERQKVGLGGMPTDAEADILAQTWSEHCKHKIFNSLVIYSDENGSTQEIDSIFDTYIKSSTMELKDELPWIKSVLWDNAGAVQINDKWLIVVKNETHNSPSQEEPIGGSITGIVGVYRDPMGTGIGAELIAGSYGFYNAHPDYEGVFRPENHPRRLLNGEIIGVEQGGNKHGVPTVWGDVFFDDGHLAKTALFAGAVGRIPVEVNGEPGYEKHIDPGDLIVMCGGRVGIDGIHGATGSSLSAGEHIPLSHVQMGDPYTQKKMHDFLLEARDRGLYKFIQDNGAGGLSSSVGESGTFSDGFIMDLEKVPLKYQGLDPWQIIISESQERMTLAVDPEKINEFQELSRAHGVESTVIGNFTDTGKYHVVYGDRAVAYMDMEFVHKGVPKFRLKATWKTPEQRGLREDFIPEVKDHARFLKHMLARPNIASKEWIIRRYDHEVGGTSVIKPLVGENSDVTSDAAVQRIDLEGMDGLAMASGSNPHYNEIDTYHGAAAAIDEAIRHVVAVGGDPDFVFLNDNFCWPSPMPYDNNPDAEYKMAQLVRANQALREYTLGFRAPCISGKDSMSMDNDTMKDKEGKKHRISALPVLRFSSYAKVPDVNRCVTMDIKKPGDLVYVLGNTKDELGGSEFYHVHNSVGLNVPKVDVETSKTTYKSLHEAIKKGIVKSAHGCYKGGLAVALAQTSFAGGYGIDVSLAELPTMGDLDDDKKLYSESAGRLVVTVDPEQEGEFRNTIQGTYNRIGRVRDDQQFKVRGRHEIIIDENIYELKGAWQKPFADM